MINLISVANKQLSNLDWYIKIRDSKREPNRSKLVEVHANLLPQLDLYLNATTHTLGQLKKDQTCAEVYEAFQSCYSPETKALKELKNEIKKAQPQGLLSYCPLCGISLPDTWDHYLPKEEFPEFSVYLLNLIPCCFKCNSIKNKDWLDSSKSRQYIHFFIDSIPDHAFLKATLHESKKHNAVGFSFNLVEPTNGNSQEWKLLKSHFKKLKLIERYTELANDEVFRIIRNCKIFRENSNNGNVVDYLKGLVSTESLIYGKSNWRVIVMKELSNYAGIDKLTKP